MDGFSSAFGKDPLISAGVENGWLPKAGFLRLLSDISLVYIPVDMSARLNYYILPFGPSKVYSPR